MKKAIVLKSLRTESGAKDWLKVFGKNYPDARIVTTDELSTYKSFGGEFDSFSRVPPMPTHVIMEEDLSPMVKIIKKSDVGEIIKAMVKAGFMEASGFGLTLTTKWHDGVNSFMKEALTGFVKSASEDEIVVHNENLPAITEYVLRSFGRVMKAMEDSEELARIKDATENDEFGHALRDNKAISDAEAKAGFEHDAPAADTRDPEMDGEAISDAEAKSAAGVPAEQQIGK